MRHIEHEPSYKISSVKVCGKEACRVPPISKLHPGAVVTSTMTLGSSAATAVNTETYLRSIAIATVASTNAN